MANPALLSYLDHDLEMISEQKSLGNLALLDFIHVLQNNLDSALNKLWKITRLAYEKKSYLDLISTLSGHLNPDENLFYPAFRDSLESLQKILEHHLNAVVTIHEYVTTKVAIPSKDQLKLGDRNLKLGSNTIIGSNFYSAQAGLKICIKSSKIKLDEVIKAVRQLTSAKHYEKLVVEIHRNSEPMILAKNATLYQRSIDICMNSR